jgi:hypothetical protein
MPPIRRRTQQTGDRAVTATEGLLNEAGCAVNELVQNDYGFDLHVQLPTHVPEESDEGWQMTPLSVLVQVKGGTYVESGVRLRRDRWGDLLGSMTPVYVAAVPAEAKPWIAAVEELLPLGLEEIRGGSYRASPERESWAPAPFVSEALAGTLLGSPRQRRWWRRLQPDLDSGSAYDRGHALLRYLLDLEILIAIGGPTMQFEDFQECEENVRLVLSNEHRLLEALQRVGLVWIGEAGEVDLRIELAAYVSEGDFVEPSGQVTDEGVSGHNNLRMIGDRIALRYLAAPAVERFLEHFDWEIEYDDDARWGW